ncbi:hypothetical protein ES703_79865 [subsurface metagenome]
MNERKVIVKNIGKNDIERGGHSFKAGKEKVVVLYEGKNKREILACCDLVIIKKKKL